MFYLGARRRLGRPTSKADRTRHVMDADPRAQVAGSSRDLLLLTAAATGMHSNHASVLLSVTALLNVTAGSALP